MQEAIDSYPGPAKYAVAVTDLRTGETVSVNGDRAHLAGCSINLFVLLQTAIDMQSGRYDAETIARIDELVSATTRSSNASTARELYEIAGDGDVQAGVRRVAALIEQLGLDGTTLDHPPLYSEDSIGGSDNWITADDANRALTALWRNELLSPQWTDYLLARLATVKPGLNYLIGILGSAGATVSHKNGFFEYSDGFVDNDVGIVTFPKDGEGAAFAMSFLSEDEPTKYGDVALGQQLVQLAYAYFSASAGR